MSDFDLDTFWDTESREHQDVAAASFATLRNEFSAMLEACTAAIQNGGKILFFGNGGSAADAQHLATELTVRYTKNRPPIAAIALTTDSSTLTAIGNDFGFEHLFARQVEAIARPGDVAIGISTSGTSANVLNGLKAARAAGAATIGLSGRDGGKMADFCDILLIIPSSTTARIQEMHITLGQMLCGALEQRLGLA
ncbi:MAG: D-sedoheptulose 7-phosphate isomerase [Alphaproteobacteria bacterium]|nr:D-sedoheptulose 7-phosphate isomerase [Alphaproteobacteria bacterium]